MNKVVMSIVDYDPKVAYVEIKGKSQTVPNEATSLKDLVKRAMLGAILPEIAKSLEYGNDEDFEDAFEPGQDLSDYCENNSFIEKYAAKIKEAKEAAKASKTAEKASQASEGVADPLEKESV